MAGSAVDPRFPERLQQLRADRGLSYAALATRTHFSKSHLHDLATGRRQPTAAAARLIDAALCASGELTAMVTPGRTDDDMQRRTLIAALAGAGLAPTVDRVGVSALLSNLADRQPEAATVADWKEAVWEYGYTYLTAPRRELMTDLAADLGAVMTLMPRATDTPTYRSLADVASQLAGLIAMVCTDLGYGRDARRSWQVARRLADDSASMRTRMWVRGQEAVLGLYSRRPLPVVLELADRGLAIGDRANVGGTASLTHARAQALALLGRRREAITALHQAEDIYGRLPDNLTQETDSIFGAPEHRLRHAASFVHGLVGKTTDAYAAQDRALALYSPAKGISRSQVNMHRAACLVRDGDVAGGVNHAATVLAGLPEYARGTLVLTVADAVLAAIPAGDRGRSDVLEYSHMLTALRSGADFEGRR